MAFIRDFIQYLAEFFSVTNSIGFGEEFFLSPEALFWFHWGAFFGLWVCFASWAGHRGKLWRKDPGLHFLLGIICPFVYPILFIGITGGYYEYKRRHPPSPPSSPLPSKIERKPIRKRQPQKPAMSTKRTPKKHRQPQEEENVAGSEDSTPFYRGLFQELGTNCCATTGKFLIKYANTSVEATEVLEVLDETVVVEMHSKKDIVKSLRIPYRRISFCGKPQDAIDTMTDEANVDDNDTEEGRETEEPQEAHETRETEEFQPNEATEDTEEDHETEVNYETENDNENEEGNETKNDTAYPTNQ